VKLSAVHRNEARLFQMVLHSMRTDEQQCLLMKTVLTVGRMCWSDCTVQIDVYWHICTEWLELSVAASSHL